jgi:hypothetical protein
VLYKTVIGVGVHDRSIGIDLLYALANFFLIFIGSFLIGAFTACVVAFVIENKQKLTINNAFIC